MPVGSLTESTIEHAALEVLADLGYQTVHGPAIAPDGPVAERERYSDVVLAGRLRGALGRLNPALTAYVLEEALRHVLALDAPTLIAANRAFHGLLVNGVGIEVARGDGSTAGEIVRLVDFDRPERNEWLAVNQFTVAENGHTRRADLVLFVNGLPLAVLELKNVADEQVELQDAFHQLQTYLQEIPGLFHYNAALAISDGVQARAGTLSSDWGRFQPWRTIDGLALDDVAMPQQDVLLRGLFDPQRFLGYLRDCIVFDTSDIVPVKKMAAYHQYHAVGKAVECTVAASAPDGNRRIGVVWHTQGSGKSLTMAFFAGAIIRHPAMENPTLVVITDRNDLDGQLFDTFCACSDLLRQTPVQAESREHLRELLHVSSGGVIFTTIQKFAPDERGDSHPLLSDRRNIVVIADEAHRSQYGLQAKVNRQDGIVTYGFAKHLRDAVPGASFIGFTGTPIEQADRSTRNIFGDDIDIYDIERAVKDGATVPIFYEARLAKLALKDEERPTIDPDFEEVTEGEEVEARERLKTKWASLEAMVGTEKRLGLVAEDLIQHFELRLDALDGKAMIVCMSRRICVDLYRQLVALRPEWHSDSDDGGAVKIVMTGSAKDPPTWQTHVRSKGKREALAKRFKNPDDPLKLVIVRDMWLTGFDAPCMHTMYVDKPMQGHTLMQAIARVNRVFRDKPGGLVVDYLGLADELKRALLEYTESGGEGTPTIDVADVLAVLQEKYEVVSAMFYGLDYGLFFTGTPQQRLALLPAAQNHILAQDPEAKRYLQAVAELSRVFALAMPHEEALAIREEVAFFQAVRAALVKTTGGGKRSKEDMESAIRQIVARAVATDGVVDIFEAAGLPHPDISILSDDFLAEIRGLPHRNLAVELLRKLLNDEIRTRLRSNVVQGRSFAQLLEQSIRKYQNRAIEAAQVIEELIALARDVRAATRRGEELGLSDDEVAFYDALAENESAKQVMGDEKLRIIAQELLQKVKQTVSIDWAVQESARARLRLLVKNILRKYGYPPDMAKAATELVLEQTEALCRGWAI
jgi:type I restriction enzyme R subunit